VDARGPQDAGSNLAAHALGGLAFAIAALDLLGWTLGIPSWTRWIASLPRMAPTSALSIALLGGAIPFAVRARAGSATGRRVALGATTVALLLAGGAVVAYASGSTLGPERLFLYDRTETVAAYRGRMSPQTAGALLCVALALVVSVTERPRRVTAQVLGAIAATLAVVALGGHIHGVVKLFGVSNVIGVALPTAVALLALSGAVAALYPDVGIRQLVTRKGPAGRYARHLLLAAAVIPPGAAILLRAGEAIGWYDASFRSGAYVGAMAVLLFAAAWMATHALQRAEDESAELAGERFARQATEAVSREMREQIEERKRAEQALRAAEQRFRLALRNAPVSVAAQDRELRYVWAYNQRTAPPEAIIGKRDDEIFTAREAAHLGEIKRRVLAENVEHREQMWLDRPGGPIYLDVFFEPIRDPVGGVVGVGSATVDLTPLKRAEEALRRSEEDARARAVQLQAVLDCIADGVLVYDREGRIVRSTPAADRFLGLPPDVRDAPVLERVTKQYEILTEDGRRVAPEDMVAVRAAVRGETVRGMVQQVRSGGGEPRWLMISGTPLMAGGDQVGAVLSMTDLTDRKRAEEELAIVTRLYAVLSRVNEAIVRTRDEQVLFEAVCRIVAEDGPFPLVWVGLVMGREVSPAAWWGSASEYLRSIRIEVDGELGRGPTGTCVREDRPVINDDFTVNPTTSPWREATARHGLRASAAFPLHRGDEVIGALTFYAGRPGAFTPDQVKLLEALCADVSYALDALEHERRRVAAEEASRESERRLREADQRKDEFLGMLSHELRNPLAPIRNSVYILGRADAGSDQALRARGIIERQAEHLSRLVDDLLDVTRIARGKIELRRSCTDLRDVVLRAADDFRPLIEARGLAFHVAATETSVWADIDATRVTQVLGNLLHNAAKFSRRGDEVTLELRAAGTQARITVRDTGAGIEPALLPYVFDAFVQGDRTLAWSDGGLGLGLALVKGIVGLHGGTVVAESGGTGMGSTFAFGLPLARAPQPEPAPARAPAPEPGRRHRVLVVDDNADGANTLAELVELLGHAAEVAYDGPSAIDKARASHPDVVLCDIGLPGMSGYEVARRLRAVCAGRTRLIALSGFAQAEDVKRAAEAGFDEHLAKPCDAAQIERLLS